MRNLKYYTTYTGRSLNIIGYTMKRYPAIINTRFYTNIYAVFGVR